MKTLYSKTLYLYKNISIGANNIKDMSFKKDDTYRVINGILEKQKSEISYAKNIFSVYSDFSFGLYKEISNSLDQVCDMYQINKEKQKYMIYGKVSSYNPSTNNNWYDFPGINIPFLHGFYFDDIQDGEINFENNKNYSSLKLTKGDLIINKPTDLIKIKTSSDIEVVEFYIAPLFALKNNEPGVWVPIL